MIKWWAVVGGEIGRHKGLKSRGIEVKVSP